MSRTTTSASAPGPLAAVARPTPTAKPTALSDAPRDRGVRVVGLDLPVATRLRLAELGVRAGHPLHVLGRTPGGGRVVAVGTTRIALDAGTARRIDVEPTTKPTVEPITSHSTDPAT